MSGGACGAGWRVGVLALLLAGATGCRHKARVAVPVIPPPQPVPVDTTAKVEQPQPMVQPVPLQSAPLPTVTVPTKKKVRKKKATAVVAAALAGSPTGTAPVLIASAEPLAETSAIGSLTPGGSDGPQQRKSAADLITALGKRLEGLSPDTKEKQKGQIVRVMNFRRQAQAALDSGDADGALTLATKAKLLLDDFAK